VPWQSVAGNGARSSGDTHQARPVLPLCPFKAERGWSSRYGKHFTEIARFGGRRNFGPAPTARHKALREGGNVRAFHFIGAAESELCTILDGKDPFMASITLTKMGNPSTRKILLGTRTLTETREQSDSDADRYFLRQRSLPGKRSTAAAVRCFVQLFQEKAGRNGGVNATVRTGTATRETRDPYSSRMSLHIKTETRAREEPDQDRNLRTYHALPRY
jgi:hypothetical protein